MTERNAAADSSEQPRPLIDEQYNRAEPPNINPQTRRLRWSLNGPLKTAITIGRDYWYDTDEVTEPYYLGPVTNGESTEDEPRTTTTPSWHPISQLPLTDPKVPSVKLSVEPLDDWDYHWMEKHDRHAFPDEKISCNWPDEEVFFGPLPGADEDPTLDGGGDEHLLVCCSQKRPVGKGVEGKVVVTPTVTEEQGGGFVSIHDFISTVHAYLMGRRDEIIEAMNEDLGRVGRPYTPETRLMVVWSGPGYVDVMDEAEWMRNRKRRKGSGKKLTDRERNELMLQRMRERYGPDFKFG